MKKVLAVVLSVLSIFSCFGCVASKSDNSDEYDGIDSAPFYYRSFNARVRDYSGNDVCFWNDGKIQFDDFIALHFDNASTQVKKSANLGVGVSYTLSMFTWEVEKNDYLNHWSPYSWYSTEYFDWLEKDEPIESWEDYYELASLGMRNDESVRFEYDTTKLRIVLTDKHKMHYSIMALQSCDNVEVKISYGSGDQFDLLTQFYVNAQ